MLPLCEAGATGTGAVCCPRQPLPWWTPPGTQRDRRSPENVRHGAHGLKRKGSHWGWGQETPLALSASSPGKKENSTFGGKNKKHSAPRTLVSTHFSWGTGAEGTPTPAAMLRGTTFVNRWGVTSLVIHAATERPLI